MDKLLTTVARYLPTAVNQFPPQKTAVQKQEIVTTEAYPVVHTLHALLRVQTVPGQSNLAPHTNMKAKLGTVWPSIPRVMCL